MRAVVAEPFAQENLERFAAAWFSALDIHAPTEDCERFLADDGLEMIFPEKTLKGLADFKAWYAGGDYADGTSAPGVINFFFDEIHTLQSLRVESESEEVVAEVIVGWQASWFEAPAARSKRTSMDATQRWTMRRASAEKNPFGLEIVTYDAVAKPFHYAPGVARL